MRRRKGVRECGCFTEKSKITIRISFEYTLEDDEGLSQGKTLDEIGSCEE